MTSAKISGMVSTPGTLDTGLSKATGTVEKMIPNGCFAIPASACP